MLLKNIETNLTKVNTFINLNNQRFLKLEDWNTYVSKSDINYFMNWKKETLLNELLHNPSFIQEFRKTYTYEILKIKNAYINHPNIPYLNNFLDNNLPNNIHFFLTKISPKIISKSYNILMLSPGHITYDLGPKYNTGSLSNVIIKISNDVTDKLVPTTTISKSYTFPYNYQLVNSGWIDYYTTINELGIETKLPIFSTEKIHLIENYNSYLRIHPSQADEYLIKSLYEAPKLSIDLIWLNKFYGEYFKLHELNPNLSEADLINFVENFTLLI